LFSCLGFVWCICLWVCNENKIFIDTAYYYGNTKTEKVLGEILDINNKKIKIATKANPWFENDFTNGKLGQLSEINIKEFKQVNIMIDEILSLPRKKYIHVFKLDINNKHYCIKNINIENNIIEISNKPSRDTRYIKRNIIKYSNNKRYLDENDQNVTNKKRKFDETISNNKCSDDIQDKTVSNKKKKIDDFSNMVSASSIRNYMLNDPLIDYLKEYNIYSLDNDNIKKRIPNSRATIQPTFDTFTKCILDAGIEFEDELIKIIRKME
jgi:hypothetical protein